MIGRNTTWLDSFIRLSAVRAALTLVWVCGGDSPTTPPSVPDPPRPTTITVTPPTAELTALGATVQLTAEVRDQNASVMAGVTVTWTTSASSVATVDLAGLVTAATTECASASSGSRRPFPTQCPRPDPRQIGTARQNVGEVPRRTKGLVKPRGRHT